MWKVTYLYNGTLKCFNDDDDINCPTYIPEGKTPEKAISDTVDYILEIYHCNCLDAEYKDGELIVTDPVDGEFICKYSNFEARKYYTLIGVDGKPYLSETPGKLSGYKVKKIYGRLDCPSAKRHIEKGQYVKNRAFFADEETAIAAGYRPCGICMKEEYRKWKQSKSNAVASDEIIAIVIRVELIMYGYVTLNIEKAEEGIIVSWTAIADGGCVISDESQELKDLDFRVLVEKLFEVELPWHEKLNQTRNWSIYYLGRNGNSIKGLDYGFWDIDILEQITEIIDSYVNDVHITEDLHDIIDV